MHTYFDHATLLSSNKTNRGIDIPLTSEGVSIAFEVYDLEKIHFYQHVLIHFYSNFHFNLLLGFNLTRSSSHITWSTQVGRSYGGITRWMRFNNHIIKRMRCNDYIIKFSFQIGRWMRCKDHITKLIKHCTKGLKYCVMPDIFTQVFFLVKPSRSHYHCHIL